MLPKNAFVIPFCSLLFCIIALPNVKAMKKSKGYQNLLKRAKNAEAEALAKIGNGSHQGRSNDGTGTVESEETIVEETPNKWFIPEGGPHYSIQIVDNGLTIKKNGFMRSIAYIRAEKPFTITGPNATDVTEIQYYEVKCTEGRGGTIAIGLAANPDYEELLDEDEALMHAAVKRAFFYASFGYFENALKLTGEYGPIFGNGHTVGCGVRVHPDGHAYVFFTFEGKLVKGHPIRIPPHLNVVELYPIVQLNGPGYELVGNFKADPTKYKAQLDAMIEAKQFVEIGN